MQPNPATLHVEMDTAIGKHTTNSTTTINELSDEVGKNMLKTVK